jgi:hypothetical protein
VSALRLAPELRAGARLGIFSALGLYILVSIFSSGTSDPNARWKILGIAIGSAVIQVYVTHLMPNLLGFLAALALSLGFIVAALMLWLKVERVPALKIVGSYFALCVALVVVFALLPHAQR